MTQLPHTHPSPGDGRSAAVPDREALAADLVGAAYLRGDFVLSSGARSSFYFDKYLFETKPDILRRVATLLAARVPAGVDRLAGPALGAVALATAVSLETGLPFVIVRAAQKDHGTSRAIEGELHPDERVLVIEDVISTAAQAIRLAGPPRGHYQQRGQQSHDRRGEPVGVLDPRVELRRRDELAEASRPVRAAEPGVGGPDQTPDGDEHECRRRGEYGQALKAEHTTS